MQSKAIPEHQNFYMNRLLQSLGEKYNTDKHDEIHSFAGKTYLDVYEDHFSSIKDSTTCLLELGVLHGKSLMMWRDYFQNAQIWGLDIDPSTKQDYGKRIDVIIGNQCNKNDLDRVAVGQGFDIIIDDASHLVDHIIQSFKLLWPRIKTKGYYCIEDTGCSYTENLEPYKNLWPGMKYNLENTNYKNDRRKLERFFLDLIKQIDFKSSNVRGVYFTTYQCIIQKL